MINVTTVEPVRRGGFALKAWGSTARFNHVKMWGRNVPLSHAGPGLWIPYHRNGSVSSQGFPVRKFDTDTEPGPVDDGEVNRPFAAQQHGFNDCNGVMGEVTSHGVFLAALMDAWVTRAHAATPLDRERLRRAIQTAVLYFAELHDEGDANGTYAHQEPGRAALAAKANPRLTTMYALSGLLSFVEKGATVDRALMRTALKRLEAAWDAFHRNDHHDPDPFLDSIVAIRVARARQREGQPADIWFDHAHKAATAVLEIFGRPGAMANSRLRFTLRTIPWFEGVYEVFARGPFELTATQRGQLAVIVSDLVALANNRANGFCIMPQADDTRQSPDPTLPARNWHNVADLPLAFKPMPVPENAPPVGDLYATLHFATAAADCVYIGRLAGERALERLATGNLYWGLGLNPGVPTTKLAPAAVPIAPPWSAASFVYNGPGVFTRTNEGNRIQESATKASLAPWEGPSGSRHREAWSIDPLNNGYATMTNGYVLREGQWHYWSVGLDGWVGERRSC